MIKHLLSLLLLLGSLGAGASEAALRHYLQTVTTFSATFTQRLYDEKQFLLEETSGRFMLQRPGRFRWDYLAPFPQQILSDGHDVWVYDQELAQATVRDLTHALGDSPALLLTSDKPLEDDFELHDLGMRDGESWVAVSPKSTDSNFNRVRLGFTDGQLRHMEMDDNFGQTTRIAFDNEQTNIEFAPGVFEFSAPANVDIIRDGDT